MTDDEAHEAVGVLVGSTPGPWTDDVVAVWVDAFMQLSDPRTLHDACRAISMHHSSNYRPKLSEVVDRYYEMVQWKRRASLPDGMVHCDGSGWVGAGDGRRPCPRCNPAVAAVYREGDKLRRYLAGEPLHRLEVGVERVRGELRWVGPQPPSCGPAVGDMLELTVPPRRGAAIARHAYAEQCVLDGREPNWPYFENVIAGLLRGRDA